MARAGSRALGVGGLIAAIGAVALLTQWVVVLLLGGSPPHLAPDASPWVPLVAVAIGFVIAELSVVFIRLGRHAYAFSLSEIPLIVGLFFVRPELLIFTRLAGALLVFVWRRPRFRKALFNYALFALEAPVAVLMWHTLVGGADPLGPRGWFASLLIALVISLMGSALVTVVIAIDTGESITKVNDVFSVGQVADLVNAVFALVVVYVISVDWRASWLVAVMIVVLVFAHRVSERLQGRTERLEQVVQFTGQVGGQLGVDAVADAVLLNVRCSVEAQRLQLRLHDENGQRCWSLRQGDPHAVSVDAADMLEAFGSSVMEALVLVPSNTRDRRLKACLRAAKVEDFLSVPLYADGRPIGVLAMADRLGDVDTFTDDDLQQVEALANHAGVAFANASRADRLRLQAAEREHQAMHDDLTGLANRRQFNEALGRQLEWGPAAVLMLDLDRFKEINDTLGHQIGDDLLCMVAERLREVAPAGALVARFGGDEFAVILPDGDRLAAVAGASAIKAGLAQPFCLTGLNVAVDASVGVAVSDVTGGDAVKLARHADVAMYAAKETRRGVEVYRPELDSYDPKRLGLLADLRHAIATNAFTLAYQPKVAVARGDVSGVEALIRWNHPLHGAIRPDEFIPLAEHSGLITPLTTLVLNSALEQCEAWRAEGLDLSVAVNISPRSLLEASFVDEVAHALAGVAVPARALTLELTETSLMADPERAVEALNQLRKLGVRLSVDDLGTGYSSLAYLQRLPVDEIKIDRSFLQAMPGEAAEAIVGAIIDLGHRLGRQVVAEGVETEAAYERLRELGCDLAQGYWLSRPVDAATVSELVRGWRRSRVSALRSIV